MIIKDSCVVSLHYSLTSDDGQQLDASHESEPLIYLHGTKSLLAGLEKGIEGRAAGDEFSVTVQPKEGYGLTDPEQIHKVPLEAFAETRNLAVGMQFELESEEGHGEQFAVVAIDDDEVTVDANHPLAGKVLHFKVSIETVRAATDEEINVGYAQE
jgi:FKBP-type peptidyl-prolyl cis-trans isomerase SlyD